MLNDFENYRTESEYRTYLIIKVFSFRFVCYFATLYYYYAVFSIGDDRRRRNREWDPPSRQWSSCLHNGRSVVANFLHVCFPMLVRKL